MFSSYLQYLITGVTIGSAYGLTALGFTMIFNTTGIVNFAQGEFVMLGGMLSVFLSRGLGVPVVAAVVLAALGATIIGGLIERLTIRPGRAKKGHEGVINLIIVTIGVSILIRGGAMLIWGKDTFALPHFGSQKPIQVLGAALLPQNLWVLGVTLAMLAGLKLFFSKTLYGKGMLACAAEPKAAWLVGVNVERMALASFMLSGLTGAVGGAILAPLTMTSYDVGMLLGLKGFAACILGGLGNPFGAAAGGIIIGVLESFGAGLISSAYKDAFAFIILLLLLFFRPSGLFGAKSSERV